MALLTTQDILYQGDLRINPVNPGRNDIDIALISTGESAGEAKFIFQVVQEFINQGGTKKTLLFDLSSSKDLSGFLEVPLESNIQTLRILWDILTPLAIPFPHKTINQSDYAVSLSENVDIFSYPVSQGTDKERITFLNNKAALVVSWLKKQLHYDIVIVYLPKLYTSNFSLINLKTKYLLVPYHFCKSSAIEDLWSIDNYVNVEKCLGYRTAICGIIPIISQIDLNTYRNRLITLQRLFGKEIIWPVFDAEEIGYGDKETYKKIWHLLQCPLPPRLWVKTRLMLQLILSCRNASDQELLPKQIAKEVRERYGVIVEPDYVRYMLNKHSIFRNMNLSRCEEMIREVNVRSI